jgi:membrane protease YdiL (CAAX protease family)
MIVEPILGLAAFGFLHLRRWQFNSLGLRINFKGILEGVGLTAIVWVACALTLNLTLMFFHLDARHLSERLIAPGINPFIGAANSIVNPLFEEIFVTGYIVSALKRQGSPWLAINLSAAIRLSYHTYQGELAVHTVLPLGLIFAAWYSRFGRLWPLVVAHGIFDFTAIMFAH